MTPKAKLFQAGFSALLAIAFLVLASPTRAEPVTLICRADTGSQSMTLRINYATGLVEQLGPSGKAFSNRIATATVSPNAISWRSKQRDYSSSKTLSESDWDGRTRDWNGQINRLDGTGQINSGLFTDAVTCREVTKPKF
jgi:hypothetical protein